MVGATSGARKLMDSNSLFLSDLGLLFDQSLHFSPPWLSRARSAIVAQGLVGCGRLLGCREPDVGGERLFAALGEMEKGWRPSVDPKMEIAGAARASLEEGGWVFGATSINLLHPYIS